VSLRLKLLIAVVVLVVAGLGVADVVTYTSLRSFLFRRVDQQLVAASDPVLHQLQEAGGPFPNPRGLGQVPPGSYGELRDSDGDLLAGPLPFNYGGQDRADPAFPAGYYRYGVSATRPDRVTIGALGGGSLRYRLLVLPVANSQGDRGTLFVAIPLSDVDDTLGRLRLIAGLVSGGVVLGLGALLWWLVRRELKPLEDMGVTAGAIAAGDLTRRVESTDERTEVGRLGIALNAMLAQIEAAFEERRASEARLRRFVADASHELRTPLTSIRGFAELFRRGAGSRPDDLTRSMRAIETEASRMGVLVDDLLLLARLDQGRPLDRVPVDLSSVAADAVASARAVEPERRVDLKAEGPAFILGDEGRLRQVADNLLDNARVHTPKQSPVRVSVDVEQDEVVLTISDEGPGLAAEATARVFERFYRGDPARSRVTGGAGLGLSIVAAIVEAHGGRVAASSPEGAGAVFEVRLPTLAAARASEAAGAPDVDQFTGEGSGNAAEGAGRQKHDGGPGRSGSDAMPEEDVPAGGSAPIGTAGES
jgi:two-component system OmpR family sensor kinase